ncbi:MAG: class II aldolase/adducin family protein [Pseudomonadota bacterium]|nr:class II aldolase/adducin family protein [Pseudomonadota bacterium]
MGPFERYEEKLIRAGLAAAGETLLLGAATPPVVPSAPPHPRQSPAGEGGAPSAPGERGGMIWNRADSLTTTLTNAARRLGRGAILAAIPPEPCRSIVRCLAAAPEGVIRPQDFETRVFLTDLPVWKTGGEEELTTRLERRRAVVAADGMIVATAKRELETAIVIYSAVSFAVFVKFFLDLLPRPGQRRAPDETTAALAAKIRSQLDRPPRGDPPPEATTPLPVGPFATETAIRAAIAATGRRTVATGLVNSSFGNISYRRNDELFITGRGRALDDLEGGIVVVPLGGPAPRDAGASTELPAHRRIVLETPYRAVLHGHPPFCVILSLDCREYDCPARGDCHRFCPRERRIAGHAVVSGEAGGGPHGLDRAVPPAVRETGAAIVHGHGVFTAGREDFRDAFRLLEELETTCRRLFFEKLLNNDGASGAPSGGSATSQPREAATP